ncbi:MAG: hypothetical protein HYY00_08275 [Chloroflexi bacterium]|nr:hypothetical protein [Chloroflexota bacterium]
MKLSELEKALSRATRTSPMRPALAGLAAGEDGGASPTNEFASAARSLLKRLQAKPDTGGIGQPATSEWF